MKKILLSLNFMFIILIVLGTFNIKSFAGVLYTLDHDCSSAQLIVSIVPDQNYGSTTDWNNGGFTISWLMSEGTSLVGDPGLTNGFNFNPQNSGNDDTYYYQVYTHTSSNQQALTSGVPFEVARIPLTYAVIFVDFIIPQSTNAWVIVNSGTSFMNTQNGNQHPTTYASVTDFDVPLFPGIFWDGVAWCGGSQTNQEPGPTDGSLNCYINGSGGLITYFDGVVNQLNIAAGADLTIGSGFALSANGATHIEDPQALIIIADPNGSGSFIDNGIITYGTNGSAQVNTYISNSVTVGSFHIHTIGPTVIDPTFSTIHPGATGVFLNAFDLQLLGTYAYRYDEPSGSWINIYQVSTPIPTAVNIALSDISGSPSILSMDGYLATAPVSTTSLSPWNPTLVNNGINGFSNPFASGLSLNTFYTNNNAVFYYNTIFYVWEHALGNYSQWDAFFGGGTGSLTLTNGVINPGQGFFGQLNSAPGAPLTFSQAARVHLHAPFIKTTLNEIPNLRISASGNYTKDEVLIRFFEGATIGFDQWGDGEKWNSMYEEATEIKTIATDLTELTINSMPPLGNELVSIPLYFKCGADDAYVITASSIENFDPGTEIWLEDLKLGGEWHSLVQNPVYEFTASPEDPENRFIVHFFSTTGISDPDAQRSAIQIYSWGQDAYIVNRGNETVQEYVAYDMMGRELHRGTLPNSTVNKITIGNVSAYYIVKVITKEGNVYTDKVFISQ